MADVGTVEGRSWIKTAIKSTNGNTLDIMGQGIANPLAAIVSGSMMLRFVGETEAADLIDAAVLEVVEKGDTLPPDLGGQATTSQVGEAVLSALG